MLDGRDDNRTGLLGGEDEATQDKVSCLAKGSDVFLTGLVPATAASLTAFEALLERGFSLPTTISLTAATYVVAQLAASRTAYDYRIASPAHADRMHGCSAGTALVGAAHALNPVASAADAYIGASGVVGSSALGQVVAFGFAGFRGIKTTLADSREAAIRFERRTGRPGLSGYLNRLAGKNCFSIGFTRLYPMGEALLHFVGPAALIKVAVDASYAIRNGAMPTTMAERIGFVGGMPGAAAIGVAYGVVGIAGYCSEAFLQSRFDVPKMRHGWTDGRLNLCGRILYGEAWFRGINDYLPGKQAESALIVGKVGTMPMVYAGAMAGAAQELCTLLGMHGLIETLSPETMGVVMLAAASVGGVGSIAAAFSQAHTRTEAMQAVRALADEDAAEADDDGADADGTLAGAAMPAGGRSTCCWLACTPRVAEVEAAAASDLTAAGIF